MLRAVPIEGVQTKGESALGQSSISGRGEPSGEFGLGLQVVRGHPRQNLEAAATRVIHQKQRDPIVVDQIAEA